MRSRDLAYNHRHVSFQPGTAAADQFPAPRSADGAHAPQPAPWASQSSLPRPSPQSMADYFFDPQSPQVSMYRPVVNHAWAVPPSASPTSSPCSRAPAQPAPPASGQPGLFGQRRLPRRSQTIAGPSAEPLLDTEDTDEDNSRSGTAAFQGSPVRNVTRPAAPRAADILSARSLSTVMPAPDLLDIEAARASPGVPGFGSFERDRKVLPCFPVKSDGLMRIAPSTLADLMRGRYTD